MPVPDQDAKSMERDCKSSGKHLKGSTKEFHLLQSVRQLHQIPNSNASVEMHITWGINRS